MLRGKHKPTQRYRAALGVNFFFAGGVAGRDTKAVANLGLAGIQPVGCKGVSNLYPFVGSILRGVVFGKYQPGAAFYTKHRNRAVKNRCAVEFKFVLNIGAANAGAAVVIIVAVNVVPFGNNLVMLRIVVAVKIVRLIHAEL